MKNIMKDDRFSLILIAGGKSVFNKDNILSLQSLHIPDNLIITSVRINVNNMKK